MIEQTSAEALSRLTRASEFLEPLRWTYSGQCHVEGVGHRHIDAHWDIEGRATIEDYDRSIWQVGLNARAGEPIPAFCISSPDGDWEVKYAMPTGHELTATSGSTQLLWNRMWERVSHSDVAATVLLLPKPLRMLFPHPLPIVPGVFGRHMGENTLHSRIFGRNALLRNVSIDDQAYLAIAHEGAAFDEAQAISIVTVLGFLAGHNLEVCAQITTGPDGRMVERELLVPHTEPEHPPAPAVECLDEATVVDLSTSLDAMISRAHALRFQHDVAIDVAIKYLQRWNGNQLDLEIRDITSALNVIIESPWLSSGRRQTC